MWGLLGNLVRSFLLLRDLFGYLIPGLVFVASAVYYVFPDHFANKSPLAIAKLASDAVTNWPILITRSSVLTSPAIVSWRSAIRFMRLLAIFAVA